MNAVLTCEGQLDRWCGQDLTWNFDGSVDLSQHFDVVASVADVDGMGEMKVPAAPLETNFQHRVEGGTEISAPRNSSCSLTCFQVGLFPVFFGSATPDPTAT